MRGLPHQGSHSYSAIAFPDKIVTFLAVYLSGSLQACMHVHCALHLHIAKLEDVDKPITTIERSLKGHSISDLSHSSYSPAIPVCVLRLRPSHFCLSPPYAQHHFLASFACTRLFINLKIRYMLRKEAAITCSHNSPRNCSGSLSARIFR